MRHLLHLRLFLQAAVIAGTTGCAFVPQIRHEPTYHNPFPQLHRVAVLPFFNLSNESTVNGAAVASAYFTEMQKIPGFEVVPPGVVQAYLEDRQVALDGATNFQILAQQMGVDAVVVGAITEFDPYYPPRIGLTTRWYAANPSFHAVPPGYGLPWGTAEEEYIPESLVFEAEFALAREQLATQSPEMPPPLMPVQNASHDGASGPGDGIESADVAELPPDWPDPRGFVPPGPAARRPLPRPQPGPVMAHTRMFDGRDAQVTRRLADYFLRQDDARFGGWQGYLRRSQDFIRFACHQHLAETLAARGGAGKTRVVWRWPVGRYELLED